MDRYQKMHQKLLRLIPTLLEISEYAKLTSPGFMDLSVNILRHETNYTDIALSHYYEQNGDLVPDPDMEIRVWKHGAIEALTYQDTYTYQTVYLDNGQQIDLNKKKDLNAFLDQWLSNLLQQGHKLEIEKAG